MRRLPREFVPFRLFGAPVVFHWTVLLMALLVLALKRFSVVGLVGALAYVLLIVAHEAGHAWVARRNRLYVHSLLIYPMHGQCQHEAARTQAQDLAVAWGGIGAQAVLFVLAMLIGLLPFPPGPVASVQTAIVVAWGPFNLLLMVLNLLPIAPLDGARAWRVLPWLVARWRERPRTRPIAKKQRRPADGERGKVVSLDEHRRRVSRSDD